MIYKNGLNFECQRCSFCCGHSPGFVYLSHRDLMALCSSLKLEPLVFARKYCRWADYYYGTQVLALLEKENYDCILWENGCSCYEGRPVQCSTYPFWSWMVKDTETWNDCAKDCPGMNKGRKWTFEEIDEQRKKYDANIPLDRREFEKMFCDGNSLELRSEV